MLSPVVEAIQIIETKRIEERRHCSCASEVGKIDKKYDVIIQCIKDNDKSARNEAARIRCQEQPAMQPNYERARVMLLEFLLMKPADITVDTVRGLFKGIIKHKFHSDEGGYYPYDIRVVDRDKQSFMSVSELTQVHGGGRIEMLMAAQSEITDLLRTELMILHEKGKI